MALCFCQYATKLSCIVSVSKTGFNTEAFKCYFKLVVGSAIEIG